MKATDIDNMVQHYRDDEMRKIHVRVNDTPWWKQNERIDTEMHNLDERAQAFRASLGTPDDEPAEEVQQQEPVDAEPTQSIAPGTKAKGVQQ